MQSPGPEIGNNRKYKDLQISTGKKAFLLRGTVLCTEYLPFESEAYHNNKVGSRRPAALVATAKLLANIGRDNCALDKDGCKHI
jgi:hypothetical protein